MAKKTKRAKSKASKKSKRKTSSKKTSASKKKARIKRDFDEFAQKVAKLESMRHELNSLDTSGFNPQVKIIRAKLKNINQIPQIRTELNKLEEAIKRKKAHRAIVSKHTVNLLQKSRSIEQDHKLMQNKIKELERRITKKRHVKKQLSSNEIHSVKDIPKLERQLSDLKKDFSEHTRVTKMKIDSGVGILVDTKFTDFINDIKSELTERIKSKEMTMDIELKADLEKNEELFAQRYSDLIKEFNKKYQDKVDAELRRDVNRKFKEKLTDALEKKKKELIERLIKEDAQRLSQEKKQMIDELSSQYQSKSSRLDKEKTSFLNKIKALYRGKEENLDDLYKRKEDNLMNSVEKMKIKLKKEMYDKAEMIKKENADKLRKELAAKERELKSTLQAEYKKKLDADLKVKEAQMEKKKKELENHIVNQAKILFASK